MTQLNASRFSKQFSLTTPIALAPMALASGGALAAACARAGALGLVGGGYGDLAWTQREYRLALQAVDSQRIGIGFITWKLDEDASALDWVLDLPLEERPRAVMLSFGDARRYAARIAASGAPLICQIQRLEQAAQALEAGAQVLVAQGAEAGGHGMNGLNGRSTLTLVPELADWLAGHAPETLLLAAGGIADGRGLAAALTLGADGALLGTRLWATQESLAPLGAKQAALAAGGDGTARSAVFDILRRKHWPAPYDFRALRNDLHRSWEGRVDALRAAPEAAQASYDAGVQAGDYSRAHATVGEAIGLVHDLPEAGVLVKRLHAQAQAVLCS
ncbi:MAG: nitronate monooxygenase [Giesbergeria sp.]|jgi:nitronate monooxygenase|nr:nitronate monooxygenase [Giesbergeria sp.]MBP6158524.1 nitronate monooxygenase [Giesbergeria sp.]MBP7082491.1 nitronate monooxygenase [Giesbergeria sp.]MBP9784413.1 nitronate monooxygenase [Giesbergeria sp.]MBP9895304.1 nitronate monooxygenase [Giesbergeria sp.]